MMRLATIFMVSVTCWAAQVSTLHGQGAPIAPFSPTNPQLCATFAAQVQEYSVEISNEHERCLHAPGKDDRPNLPPDSPFCSRFACQYLHDNLYSDTSPLSVKVLRKEIDTCNSQVKDYLDQQAAEKREADAREQAERDEQTAEEERKKQEEEQGQHREKEREEEATRRNSPAGPVRPMSPEPASPKPSTSLAVLPPTQATGQPYKIDSMNVSDTPAVEEARQAAKEREQKELSDEALKEMTNPFGQSGNTSSSSSTAATPENVVDPFGNPPNKGTSDNSSEVSLSDPFADGGSKGLESKSDKKIAGETAKDIAWDKFTGGLKEASEQLDKNLDKARSIMSPDEFDAYAKAVANARGVLDGLRYTLKVVTYNQDIQKWKDDPRNGWGPLANDLMKDGFSTVLKQISPYWAEVYGGPVGWAGTILLKSSSTQTPEQDFDPMSVINEPSRYSFEQRTEALQRIYISQATHPEVWNASKCQWLWNLTVQIYNSPDNPNIHLSPPNSSNVQITSP